MSEAKIEIVEYLLYNFVKWHKEENKTENDISTLKFMCLFYLTITTDIYKYSTGTLLDDTFTELWAEPYGVVERDVKKYLQTSEKINNVSVVSSEVEPVCKDGRIKIQLLRLKEINKDIINYSSFDLVDMIRHTYAWHFYYDKARKKKEYSCKIEIEIIKNEHRLYSKI